MAKKNAEVVLEYSTAYPFRLQGSTIICVYCCECFQDPNEFRQHMDESHQTFTVSTAFAHCRLTLKVDLTGLKCRLCYEPYDDLQAVAQHIYEEHHCKRLDLSQEISLQPYKLDKGNWQCVICSMQLPTLVKLGRHTTAHYLKFTCDICGRNYFTNEALKYHLRLSHSGKLTCRRCWQEFPDAESKKDHIRNSKPCWCFCCLHCGDRFMSWEAKQRHLVEVHGHQQTIYNCSACDKVFENRKCFYKHYKIQHTDDYFPCGFCTQKFAHKRDLDEHQIGHTGEKLYKCSVCSKSFSRDKSLKQHMWIHSECKRFSCEICTKQFAQKISLKGHLKSHHPDVYVEF